MTPKRVLVTGDVTVEHHLYQDVPGVAEVPRLGGAALLFDLLRGLADLPEPKVMAPAFGLNPTIQEALPPALHSYTLWSREVTEKNGESKECWRLNRPFGGGTGSALDFSYQEFASSECERVPDVLVIDDAGKGFRSVVSRPAWPVFLQSESSAEVPRWIVMSMSTSVGVGDLWTRLQKGCMDRLIVVVSANDIRHENVNISRGISWERSAHELMHELTSNLAISDLLQCAHLVINFGTEGALVTSQLPQKERTWRLIFDAHHLEGEWGRKHTDVNLQESALLGASVVEQIVRTNAGAGDLDLTAGIKAGLSALRQLAKCGHVKEKPDHDPTFPLSEVIAAMISPPQEFTETSIPLLTPGMDASNSPWKILNGRSAPGGEALADPLFAIARHVSVWGPSRLGAVPSLQIGDLLSVDRDEIEALMGLRRLITHYLKDGKQKTPLSLAVFGPPGSGKSFSVKQVAKAVLGEKAPILEFNLAQFANPTELIGAFHLVRDAVLKGETPVVFWDEFDSREYMWLQYLLAPMQDGKFQEGQLIHPIGRCIFVFAGGTCDEMSGFSPKDSTTVVDSPLSPAEHQRLRERFEKFRLLKGPDFVSRLSGYLNVLGPNPRQLRDELGRPSPDPQDVSYPVRRALFLRAVLGFKGSDRQLRIDQGLLFALLSTASYRHGSRCLEKVLQNFSLPDTQHIHRSDLPPRDTLHMHVEYDDFVEMMSISQSLAHEAQMLAPFVHGFYLQGMESSGAEISYPEIFEKLVPDMQRDNREAASRIAEILALVNFKIVPSTDHPPVSESELLEILEAAMPILAEVEHERWMEYRLKNGWRYGEVRDNARRIHPSLVPFAELPEDIKERDRTAVQAFPKILKIAKKQVCRIRSQA